MVLKTAELRMQLRIVDDALVDLKIAVIRDKAAIKKLEEERDQIYGALDCEREKGE